MNAGSSDHRGPTRSTDNRPGLDLLVLAVCIVAFLLHCLEYAVVQDDAYISFVYSKNMALGNGLVFNLGERVEGYTNFLWTLIHVLPHLVGLEAATTSQVLGFFSAAGLFAATLALARQVRPSDSSLSYTPVLVLLAANGSLALWTLSGMETLLFSMLVTAGALTYLRQLAGRGSGWSTGAIFGLAALTRPEGLLFFALTCLHWLSLKLLDRDLRISDLVPLAVPFLSLVIPHFVFRVAYYGFPLPNTFYAKTGIGSEYVVDGLLYTWKFLVDYGFWGLGLVVPLALAVGTRARAVHLYVGLMIWGYALYVTAVGGDTLPQNRFYLPIVALMYLELGEFGHLAARAFGDWLSRMTTRALATRAQLVCSVLLLATMGYYTFYHARPQIQHVVLASQEHNEGLHELADYINSQPSSGDLLVSSTAIGIPRYFTDASILDLVGLTDEVIAHDPKPLPGIRSAHRLRSYNVRYVMDRAPNLIYFISGERPIPPAEKALFMSQRFRQGYYLTYMSDDRPVYARRPGVSQPEELIHSSGEFVELYSRGLSASSQDSTEAILREAIPLVPKDFAYAHAWLGRRLTDQGRLDEAATLLQEALAIDSTCVKALAHLSILRGVSGRVPEAVDLARRSVELAPLSHYCQYAYGRALVASGRFESAVPVLLEALKLDGNAPTSVDAGFRLGVACYNLDAPKRARVAWEAVLRADTGHAGALTGIQMLDEGT